MDPLFHPGENTPGSGAEPQRPTSGATLENWQVAGFGLYLHWPFCQSKCPYCDFNSHVAGTVDQTAWRDAYLSEIHRHGPETGGRVLSSVYFGGGTPSLMDPGVVAAVLDAISETWTLANDVEITLEANPGSVEAGRFAGYRSAGVNRVSLGVQALNDPDLRRLGRLHSAAEARAAVAIAQRTFERVSFDLIYARQDQRLPDWKKELDAALALGTDHLSLYQLTIEPGTAFGARHAQGRLRGLPEDDLAADLFFLTQDLCEAAGLPAYETSNHARPGAESRHNRIYWKTGDYLGIGPGAHGRLTLGGTRWATETPLSPDTWLAQVNSGRAGDRVRERISPQDTATEYAMMCLRLTEGLDMDRFASLGGSIPPGAFKELETLGLLERIGSVLRTTRKGRPLLNAILKRLLV